MKYKYIAIPSIIIIAFLIIIYLGSLGYYPFRLLSGDLKLYQPKYTIMFYLMNDNSHNDPLPINNGSGTIFIFYPQNNKTVVMPIMNFTGKLTINLKQLINYSKYWEDKYGNLINNIVPSLIIFYSYSLPLENGSYAYYSTVYILNLNLTQILLSESSPGSIPSHVYIDLIKNTKPVYVYNANKIIQNSSNNIYNSQSLTSTTTTPPTTYGTSNANIICNDYYTMNSIVYYPNSSSFGPLPIATSWFDDYGNETLNKYVYGALKYSIGSSVNQIGLYTVDIEEQSIPIVTLYDSTFFVKTLNEISASRNLQWDYPVNTSSPFAEIYTLGQLAIGNYTLWTPNPIYGSHDIIISCNYKPAETQDLIFLTGLQVNQSSSAAIPALYETNIPNPLPFPLSPLELKEFNTSYWYQYEELIPYYFNLSNLRAIPNNNFNYYYNGGTYLAPNGIEATSGYTATLTLLVYNVSTLVDNSYALGSFSTDLIISTLSDSVTLPEWVDYLPSVGLSFQIVEQNINSLELICGASIQPPSNSINNSILYVYASNDTLNVIYLNNLQQSVGPIWQGDCLFNATIP